MEVLHKMPLDEIAEIEAISKQCHKLHIVPPAYATLGLEVKDLRSGEVVSKYDDLSRSWTRNQNNRMACQTLCTGTQTLGSGTFGAGYLSMKKTDGTVVQEANYVPTIGGLYTGIAYTNDTGAGYGWRGDVAFTSANGIVIGTNDTAESFEDYHMNALVAEGQSAGQMNYGAMALPAVTWEVGTKQFKQVGERVIVNNSAGTITVKEVGIYTNVIKPSGVFCISRDVLVSPIACEAVSLLTVTYTLYSPAYP